MCKYLNLEIKCKMIESLKSNIEDYKNNALDTPNLQIIEKTFSNEVITFPVEFLVDLTFYSSTFKNSRLIDIKFKNINFESSFFEGCFLENCVFDNASLHSVEFQNCTLKNCLLINCNLVDINFIRIIFDECQFQLVEKGSITQGWFESCHFIKTIFNCINRAQLGSAVLINSKFSNSKNSIEFKGDFYLSDILRSESGVTGMLLE